MSNLVEHAKKEFKVLGWDSLPEDNMQTWVVENLIELLEVFSNQGHSGSSAPYVINLFKRLANFDPIAPLTNEEDDWNDTGFGLQHKRCSEVFKDEDGKVYWGFGRVFTDGKGGTWVGKGSRVEIKKFPWYRQEKPQVIHERWRWLYSWK